MGARIDFQNELEEILGSREVYYQAPSNSKRMSYPAIIYSLRSIDNTFTDNKTSLQDISYEVIVIDEDPDSEVVFNISKMPKTKFYRRYISDNLYHNVFHVFY